jgi:AraC family transcriptional regulator of arabinose operon
MFRRNDNLMSYNFQEEKISDEIVLCDVGYEKCKPCHTYGPCQRSYWLFHVILSGKGTFKRDGKTYELKKGQVFLIRPSEITVYSASATEPWTYVWLGFNDTPTARKLMSEGLLKSESVFSVNPDFGYEIESLYRSTTDDMELLYRATAMVYKLFGEIHAQSGDKKRLSNDTIKRAVTFIEYNYHRDIDVSWLASELGMSRGHFTSLFTKVMGSSPYNYVTLYRIAKAQALLLSSTLNITEIAFAVGFTSVSRFDFMFQKYEGVSPKTYREGNGSI